MPLARTASLLLALVLAPLVVGGAQGTDSTAASGKQTKQAKREGTLNAAPDWFFSPPRDTAFVLVTATATASDLQMALDKARLQGRLTLGEEMNTRLEGMTKRFAGEMKETGAKAKAVSQFEQTTKSVVSQVLVGSRLREQQWYAEEDGYRVYVLMELPMASTKKELVEEVKANKVLLTQARTSKSFKDLEAEVAKLTGGAP